MERLTNHFDYCKMIDCKFYDAELFKQEKCKFFDNSIVHCHQKRLNDKLREYEDLEEQGLLLKLPCKVGDTVFVIGSKYRAGREEKWINTGKFRFSDLERLGVSVFITKEEAEAALKRTGE